MAEIRGRGMDPTPHLMFVFPGPIHEPEDYFNARLRRLSEHYRGWVVTTGGAPRELEIGAFRVAIVGAGHAGGLRTAIDLARKASALVREERSRGASPDAVIAYDPLKSGLVASHVAKRAGIPLIVELNGDYTDEVTFSDIANPMTRWTKRRVYRAVARRVLRRASGVKALHPGLIEPFSEELEGTTVRLYPDFADLSYFEDLGESPEVLFVGHPFYLKGVDILIEAFKRVSGDFPEWRLKVLGWFPDTAPLKAAIGSDSRIEIHPPVPRREVAEHMGRCGILVLPSRTEAMGRVLLEAMACSKPRIGSRVGGIPRVIEHDQDGLLVPPADVSALAAALRRLMSDGNLRRRLGINGRERVRRDFSLDAYAEHTREFYDTVLSRGVNKGASPHMSERVESEGSQ